MPVCYVKRNAIKEIKCWTWEGFLIISVDRVRTYRQYHTKSKHGGIISDASIERVKRLTDSYYSQIDMNLFGVILSIFPKEITYFTSKDKFNV